VVQRRVNNAWQEVARSAGGVLELTNLTPGTTYTFRIYSVASPITGYSDSPPSAPITFTTLAGPDAVPPTAPPAPIFSSITTTMVTVYWGESTDNVEVTGYYLQQLIGGVWTTIRTVTPAQRFQTVTGLAAGTAYQFAAIAFDARGNQSPRGAAGSVTTLATTATATCRIQTIVFGTNFSTWITVINTTTVPLTGWSIQFTLSPTVATSGINGTITRSGSSATFTPAVWFTTISPGGQATVGAQGAGTPFSPPANFTLNGVPCTTV
jgi:chitodextrinase